MAKGERYAVVLREIADEAGAWHCAEPQLMPVSKAEALRDSTAAGPHAKRKRVSIVGEVEVTFPAYHAADLAERAAAVAETAAKGAAHDAYQREIHKPGYHARRKAERPGAKSSRG